MEEYLNKRESKNLAPSTGSGPFLCPFYGVWVAEEGTQKQVDIRLASRKFIQFQHLYPCDITQHPDILPALPSDSPHRSPLNSGMGALNVAVLVQ